MSADDRWNDQYDRYAATITRIANGETTPGETGPFDPAWLHANHITRTDLRILARAIGMRLEYADPAVHALQDQSTRIRDQWDHTRKDTTR